MTFVNSLKELDETEPKLEEKLVVEVKKEPVKANTIQFTEIRKKVEKPVEKKKSILEKILDFIKSMF